MSVSRGSNLINNESLKRCNKLVAWESTVNVIVLR